MAEKLTLYRELECDNYLEINQQLFIWVQSLNLVPDDFWNPVDAIAVVKSAPLFAAWLKQKNLLISDAAITYGIKTDCCGPHIDTPPARYKLSWPISNTKGSWNRWFRSKTHKNNVTLNHWGGKTFHDPDNLEEISRREVLMPALIDAGIIHDVWFEPDFDAWPRIGLQCKLFKEPSYL